MTLRQKNFLNRFTTLPVLIDLLRRRKLVLLSPDKWEDRNDAEVMLEYKERRKLRHLYAVCFSEADETIHHWNAFASGPSGCCIEFDRGLLLQAVKAANGKIRTGSVKYKKLRELSDESVKVSDMPFTKRWPYRCEDEFRIIFESREEAATQNGLLDIEIDLNIIRRITINQRMPEMIYQTIKEYLRKECAHPEQKIHKSTLYENRTWISMFKRA